MWFALLALHADAVGLFTRGVVDKTKWNYAVNQPDVLISENWLLGYEANQQGWLVTPAVAADPIFSAMSAAAVSFYDLAEARTTIPFSRSRNSGWPVAELLRLMPRVVLCNGSYLALTRDWNDLDEFYQSESLRRCFLKVLLNYGAYV